MNHKELVEEFLALSASTGHLERRMEVLEEGGRLESKLDALEKAVAVLKEAI